MARKRTKKNIGLEPNLYVTKRNGKSYFKYRRPDTGKFYGLGTDRQKAQTAARQLNARLTTCTDLVAVVMETTGQTIGQATKLFRKERVNDNNNMADSTKEAKNSRLNLIDRKIGTRLVAKFETIDVVEYLDSYENDAYRQHRSLLNQLFDFTITKGWRKNNPVSATLARDVNAAGKLRQRLTVSQFTAIRKIAPEWFAIAMDLALLTCQGRFEVSSMQFSNIEDNVLYVIREKTKKHESARVAIQITSSLQKIINKAKALPPLSQHLVHKSQRQGGRKTSVSPETLTRTFKKLRDQCEEFTKAPMDERPTFHEIRALGANQLENLGVAKQAIQHLMGHADESMTEVYLEGHGEKWVAATAGDYLI
jgi:integrase